MADWRSCTGWLVKTIGGSEPNRRIALMESEDTTGMPDACVTTVAIVVCVSREFMCVVSEGTFSTKPASIATCLRSHGEARLIQERWVGVTGRRGACAAAA